MGDGETEELNHDVTKDNVTNDRLDESDGASLTLLALLSLVPETARKAAIYGMRLRE